MGVARVAAGERVFLGLAGPLSAAGARDGSGLGEIGEDGFDAAQITGGEEGVDAGDHLTRLHTRQRCRRLRGRCRHHRLQARLAQRKADIVDPSLALSIEERLKGLASRSLDIVQEKLDQIPSFDNAFKVLELSTKALGYGARQQNVAVQQNFVVAMPTKVPDAQAWASQHRADGLGAGVTDVTVR